MTVTVLPPLDLRTQAFVGGTFAPAADGRTFPSISPRDGAVLSDVARCGSEDVDRAVRAAREAHSRGDWAFADPAERGRVLIRLSQLMLDRHEWLAQVESRDTGHPISDARRVDVPGAARCFAWYGQAVDKVTRWC
jgi:4-guanidinobutyraldehyde dehydrogenase/NAD-dependent aldehyde dehydrogenase